MTPRPALLAIALLLLACDAPSKEEAKSMMEEVAQEKVAAVDARVSELTKTVQEREEQLKKVDTLETQLADLSSQTVALEVQLADAQSRIDTLEKANEKVVPPPSPGRPDPAAYYKVPVGDAQTIGPDTALVTIVTWSDFQCPFCSRVSPTIDELRKDYGEDLRYAFKHNPLAFHTNARAAAIAAEAAGEQGKFWQMHDKLFANQRDLTEKNFVAWARELKLDVKQFKRDLSSATIAARVDAHQQEGNKLGARGTPAFFVNGRFLSGAQPAASFKVLIDEELGKAKAKVAAGTAPSRVYDETIASGRTAP